ncbi:MAG: hypothetical protein NZ651_00100 [Candidatus Bipolaricaulota bacterium]|nr:hypothetical protein [Candidatus Bipolaricaulota bacterium]MDW8126172.1 SdrD B-like domain-containing protein [Candidatus Bipolaricaulota bacterium]
MKPGKKTLFSAVLLGFFSAFVFAAPVSLVCISPERTVAPRSVTTLAFRFTNLANFLDTYGVSFALPPGISVLVAPETVELGPGETKVVLVSLFVSALTPAGEHEIGVRVQSHTVPAHTAETKARVLVLPQAGVELRLPAGTQAWPGTKITYTLWVINRGNVLDSFQVEVNTPWRFDLFPRVVHLMPGEAAEVTLSLSLPETAKPGERSGCWVTVRSLADPEVYEAGWIWTTVLPPPPERVSISLFPLVPARLSWTGKLTDSFSSEFCLFLGGMIAPNRYAAATGKLALSPKGREFLDGWVEYREPSWEIRLGQIGYTTPIGDVSGLGLRYSYHPLACAYQSTIYFYDGETLFHFYFRLDKILLDLYSQLGDDFVLLGTLFSDQTSFKFQVGNSPSLSISTHGSPAISGELSWGSKVTVGLCGEWLPFFARFSYTGEGTCIRVLGRLGFSPNFLRTLHFRVSLELEGKRDEGPASLDTLDTKLCLGFYDSARPLSWSILGEFLSSADRLATVSVATFTLKGHLTYWSTTNYSLCMAGEVTQWFSGTVRSELCLGTTFPFPMGLWGELRLVLLGEEELSFCLRGADWTAQVTKKQGFLGLNFEARFQAPFPLFETMGRVEGVVFVDENANGVQDPGERGLEGVLLQLDKEQALTGTGGAFRFYPMAPGNYQLQILTPMPLYCPQPELPLNVRIVAGQVTTVRIALVPAATLSGHVLAYRPAGNALTLTNKNTWVVDRPLAQARVILTNGTVRHSTLTDDRGSFFFQGLCPGTWELRVELPPMAPPHYVEQEVYVLVLTAGESRTIEIRVLPRAREIRPLGELRQPVSVANPP